MGSCRDHAPAIVSSQLCSKGLGVELRVCTWTPAFFWLQGTGGRQLGGEMIWWQMSIPKEGGPRGLAQLQRGC